LELLKIEDGSFDYFHHGMRKWLAVGFLLGALLLGVAEISFSGWSRFEAIRGATEALQYSKPLFSETSVTGYRNGVRLWVMPYGADALHWIMMAQQMAQEGTWRLRHVDYDNAPFGREVHWSQFLLWWLNGLGHLLSAVNGMPLGAAIEAAGIWALAPLQLAALLFLPFIFLRHLGFVGSGLLAIGLGSTYSISNLFMVGATDHHGLVAVALLVSLLYLVLAFLRIGSDNRPLRRMVLASGLWMASAIWISAATALPCIGGVFAGILLFIVLEKEAVILAQTSRCVLLWCAVVGVASIGFYLLEYFPGNMGMRLEVNHPIYAVSILSFGCLTRQLVAFKGKASFAAVLRDWPRLTLCFALLCLLLSPVALMVFRSREVFIPSDPFLYRLHKEFIHEFKPFLSWLTVQPLDDLVLSLSPLLLVPAFCVILLRCARLTASDRLAIFVAMGAPLPMILLSYLQIRWFSISVVLLIPAMLLVYLILRRTRLPHEVTDRWVRIAGVTLIVFFTIQLPQRSIRFISSGPLDFASTHSAESLVMIYARDIAYRLKAIAGNDPVVVLSGPTSSTWLIYFGGLRGVGTLYWENVEGLTAAGRTYSAPDESAFLEEIRKRNVRFMVVFSVDMFLTEYRRLFELSESSEPREHQSETFLFKMVSGLAPKWVRGVSVPQPAETDKLWCSVFDLGKSEPPSRDAN